MAPSARAELDQLGEAHRRADAVLVPHTRVDREAQRLLVAEHEPQLGVVEPGAHHPLEAGGHLGVVDAGRLGLTAQQLRRHIGGDHQPIVASVIDRMWSASRAPIWSPVSATQPDPSGSGHHDGQAVGVGIVGQHQVGPDRPGPAPPPDPWRRAPRGWGTAGWGSRGRARTGRPPRPRGRSRRGPGRPGPWRRPRRASGCRRCAAARRARGPRPGRGRMAARGRLRRGPGRPRAPRGRAGRCPDRPRRPAGSGAAAARSMASAISASVGGMIWAPSPRYTL